MFGKGGLGGLMKQAQQMQEKMQKMQEEIAQLEVTGESGAGLVKITINGAHNCRRIEIDPSLMEDDKEMLEDLIAAAFNDAVRRAEELQKEKMASVTAGMPLPPGMKLPFYFIGCVNLHVHTPFIFSHHKYYAKQSTFRTSY